MSRPQTLTKSLPGLWRIGQYFWPQVRKHRGLVLGSMLALFAEIGLRLLEPWPVKFVFDRVIATSRGARAWGVPALANFSPTALIALAALGAAAISGVRALAAYWNTIGFAKLGNRVLTQVRSQLYRHVQYLSLSFHTKAKTGDLVVRVIGDVGMLQDVAVTALLPLLGRLLILVGMLVVMFSLNWQLALIALAVFPPFWLRNVRLIQRIRDVARRQRQREGAMAATAAESISAIKTVQALSLEGAFAQVFSRENEKSLKQDVQAKRLSANLERSVDVLTAVSAALVLYFGVPQVLLNEISAGDLLVFLAYLRYVFRPVQDFAKYTGRLGKASAAGERVLDLLDRVPDVRDLPGAVPAPPLRGAVRFEAVSFAYEPGRPALDEIACDVQPGELVALMGPSGSGKTTFVSLILRLYDPTAGRVLIDGRDIREYTLASLRPQMSVVLQDSLLFATTIRDNIAYGASGGPNPPPPPPPAEAIEAAAGLANAHAFVTALPQGYD